MSFSQLGLTPSICLPLARLGYEQPTPIQAKAIPAVLRGADLLARAQTGTGKTAAFGLPMIQRIMAGRAGGRARLPRGLVLVPTRELAAQVHRSLVTYGAPVQLRVTAIFGGVGMGAQIQSLRRGADIVVATPGPADRPPAAAHCRSLRDRDPYVGRRRPDAGPGLSARTAPDHGVPPAVASDLALFRDSVPRSRRPGSRVHS